MNFSLNDSKREAHIENRSTFEGASPRYCKMLGIVEGSSPTAGFSYV